MNQPYRVLHVGCGGMSGVWLRTAALFPDDFQIVGLVDLDLECARQRAAEFGLSDCWTGTDLAGALAVLNPDIVFDCTVPAAHMSVTLAALEHGAHILGEKPIADTMENARRMVRAAKDRGKIYAITQSRRPDPALRTVQQALVSGLIGRVHTINADFYIGAHFGGFRAEMNHVLLLDMAVHSFDQARCLSGLDPVSVYCHEYNPPGSWYRHGANAMAIFEMEGGALFNYRGSWCAEGADTSWECNWRIVGDKGTLLWDGGEEVKAFSTTAAPGLIWPVQELVVKPVELPPDQRGHAGIFEDFIKALRKGGQPETECGDNLKSLAMVFAAIESAEAGARVAVSGSWE